MTSETVGRGDGAESAESLFGTLVKNSLAGIFLFQDRIIYLNPTFERILGRTAQEICSGDIFQFIHPEDRELVRQRAALRLEGKLKPEPYSFRILHPVEGIKWVILVAERTLYRGRPALLGNIIDITAQVEAQQQIQQTKALFEGLFLGSPDAIAILDLEGRVRQVNPAFQNLFQYSPEEAVGHFMWELIEPRDRAGEGRENQRRVLSRQTVRMETVRRRKDGALLEVVITGYPILDGDRVQGIYAIYQDISEQKRAQKALERAERRYRELVEQVPAGVYEIEVESARFLTVNDYMCRLFGYSREEFLSMTGFDLWTDEGKYILQERINRILQGFPVPQTVEYPGKTKDGRELWVRVHSRFGHDDSGRPIARVVMLDMTEQRRLQEQFLQAQKMEAMGRLAGGVAHDINNALTAVLGYADLILAADPTPSIGEAAQEIKAAAHRAASITSQLLAFSRKQLMKPQLLDLNDVVSRLTKMLAPLIGEDVRLELSLCPEPLRIEADPAQLEQALVNLAINSRDAMPQGGVLRMETAKVELDEKYAQEHGGEVEPGTYARLTISDTGLGMDQETIRHIFEPFFTTKERGKGTGLGLSTVYGIVKQVGGHIWVYSKPGIGTSFKIYLPCLEHAKKEGIISRAEPQQQERWPTGSERVLVVEDSDQVRKLIRFSLQRFGYEVMEAPDAESALALLEKTEGSPELLITDVLLPGISGPQLAARAREILPGLRVLYISGYTGDFMARTGVLEPGLDLLEKPFSPMALVRKAREILDR